MFNSKRMVLSSLALASLVGYLLGQAALGESGRWQVLDFAAEAVSVQPAVMGIEDKLRLACAPCAADFDADGQAEWLTTAQGQALILSEGQTMWQSPPAWRVAQAEVSDFDRNGLPEAALLVWRPFQPWPVDRYLPYGGRIAGFHDSAGQSCHLVLIGWVSGHYDEVWAGSALSAPLLSFAALDLNGDGHQELLALEGHYNDPPGASAWALSVWEWHGFGFRLLARATGPFSELRTAPAGVLVR